MAGERHIHDLLPRGQVTESTRDGKEVPVLEQLPSGVDSGEDSDKDFRGAGKDFANWTVPASCRFALLLLSRWSNTEHSLRFRAEAGELMPLRIGQRSCGVDCGVSAVEKIASFVGQLKTPLAHREKIEIRGDIRPSCGLKVRR